MALDRLRWGQALSRNDSLGATRETRVKAKTAPWDARKEGPDGEESPVSDKGVFF